MHMYTHLVMHTYFSNAFSFPIAGWEYTSLLTALSVKNLFYMPQHFRLILLLRSPARLNFEPSVLFSPRLSPYYLLSIRPKVISHLNANHYTIFSDVYLQTLVIIHILFNIVLAVQARLPLGFLYQSFKCAQTNNLFHYLPFFSVLFELFAYFIISASNRVFSYIFKLLDDS